MILLYWAILIKAPIMALKIQPKIIKTTPNIQESTSAAYLVTVPVSAKPKCGMNKNVNTKTAPRTAKNTVWRRKCKKLKKLFKNGFIFFDFEANFPLFLI